MQRTYLYSSLRPQIVNTLPYVLHHSLCLSHQLLYTHIESLTYKWTQRLCCSPFAYSLKTERQNVRFTRIRILICFAHWCIPGAQNWAWHRACAKKTHTHNQNSYWMRGEVNSPKSYLCKRRNHGFTLGHPASMIW